jgi:hypothetical protein
MLAPPFVVEETHMFEMVDKLDRTLDEALETSP